MSSALSSTQEIKSRLNIVDIIQEYIQLKSAGTHNFKALCPFHSEKSPSFMVSVDKQIWHCFGCGKGGDIFTFVQEYEGMSFPESLRHLAAKAGVKLVHQDPILTDQKSRLLALLDLTAKFYHEYLLKKSRAEIARKYLIERHVKPETSEQFQLGYSPDSWDETKNFLKQKGYNDKDIATAGLLVKNEAKNIFYDRFRGRLMFPIFDHNNVVVGFGARALKSEEEKSAKYINSPQSIVYDKSQIVYGLNFAKQEIKKKDLTLIVEGYMDAIACHQAGFKNTVAVSGTALTLQQLQLLKRYSSRIALSFDADLAGENAAKRGVENALSFGMEISIITIPVGKDPDECIKNNPQDWNNAVASATEFMQYYFDKTFDKFDISKVQDKKKAAKILLEIIKKISDAIEQTFWLKKLAGKLDVDETILASAMKGIKLPAPNNNPAQKIITPTPLKIVKAKEELLSEKLLAVILIQPPILEIASQSLMPEMLVGQSNQNLYKSLIIYYTETNNREGISNYREFLAKQYPDLAENYYILELLAVKEFADLNNDEIKREGLNFIENIKQSFIMNKRKELQRQMQDAESQGDVKLIEELTKKFNELI